MKEVKISELVIFLTVPIILALAVVAGLNKVTPVPTCYQTLAEQDVVAKIATATGKLPGDPKTYKPGTVFKVKPDYCKTK